jgi:hypothetical protein
MKTYEIRCEDRVITFSGDLVHAYQANTQGRFTSTDLALSSFPDCDKV